jgi:hypothetical protein
MAINTQLTNGARIIAEFKYMDWHIVLCSQTELDNFLEPYVVWDVGPSSRQDQKQPCYNGRYFRNSENARAKFIEATSRALGVTS